MAAGSFSVHRGTSSPTLIRSGARPAKAGMQRVRVAALVIVIGALHVAGFAALAAGFVSVGLGLTAYTLGARHAFDADHIAAIDGTTRKLTARGERPVSVGFFFALGHATVVFGAATLLALGVHVIGGHFAPGPRHAAFRAV